MARTLVPFKLNLTFFENIEMLHYAHRIANKDKKNFTLKIQFYVYFLFFPRKIFVSHIVKENFYGNEKMKAKII